MQRFCFRVEAGVAVEARDTLGTDELRKHLAAPRQTPAIAYRSRRDRT
jgi:hypothetical protein